RGRAGDRRRDRHAGRLRRGAGPRRDLHGWARRRRVPAPPPGRRHLARCARVDRSSRGQLHGVPVRGVGAPGGEVLREGAGAAARGGEVGLHTADARGLVATNGVARLASARLPPVAENDLEAIGRTNDCILYGGQARYTVNADGAELTALVPKIPAAASKDYGTPFYEIFKRYDGDFYRIDPLLFSPAEVWLTIVESGKTYHAGHLNPEVLRASLLET